MKENFDGFEIVDGIVMSYKGNDKVVAIPEGVCAVADGVFLNNTSIEKITIPSTLKEWGVYAFSKMETLKEAVICEGVKSIHRYAFSDCKKLEKISLPESLESIIGGAFEGCPNLKDVKLPAGLKLMTEGCFDDQNEILKANPQCRPEILSPIELAEKSGLRN